MAGIFGPEENTQDINYANHSVGDFIRFKKNNNTNLLYGIICGDSTDNDDGKRFPFIYYDVIERSPINTNNYPNDTAARQAQDQQAVATAPRKVETFLEERIINNQLFYYLKYNEDNIFRMLYDATVVVPTSIPDDIRDILLTAFQLVTNQFATPTVSPFSTPSVSRSSTDTYGYGDISRGSSNSSNSSNSSVGGKRYRKRKNKTKRRNRKTKRRRNRKSKRR